MEFNLMMVVCEDDLHLKSTFFLDLGNLLKQYNTNPIHIIYHSEHYYDSFLIEINKDIFISKKIKEIKINYKNIKTCIETVYKNYYIVGKKNILYYGGHSHWLFKDTKTSLNTNIFEHITDIELLILDSCYTSYTNLLSSLIGKMKYVIACSTTGPNLGFLNEQFIDTLHKKDIKDIDKYKTIIDLFIRRNSKDNKLYKNFNYRTDASLIDMVSYVDVHNYIHLHTIDKNLKCKIEHDSYYYFYDLICLTDDIQFIRKIKKSILYFKTNDLTKIHFKKKNIFLNGMIIGIK
jgi:hypothetical protein